ncbi:MAG: hypothetical protein COA57_15905 [Flavobacteriales bacterium]|nr:MAG: hypothetical protein COA57_15905 [Flavobacteriales bacterium]
MTAKGRENGMQPLTAKSENYCTGSCDCYWSKLVNSINSLPTSFSQHAERLAGIGAFHEVGLLLEFRLPKCQRRKKFIRK